MWPSSIRALYVLGLSLAVGSSICAETNVQKIGSRQINLLIENGWSQQGIQPAKRCSDRTFVRRAYLDIAGRVPTVSEVQLFLDNDDKDKREQLVDQLLHSEDYVNHFADVFDALLMGRTDERKYAERVRHGWRDYLETVFRENRPWDEVAKEVLLARPENPDADGAVWFLYERDNKYQEIAESVAPAFFGIRIECAQCHDHMVAEEIKQAHYWGLVAFFNRGRNQQTNNGPRVAESAIGGFSEFADLSGDSSPNHLTFFAAQTVDEPRPESTEKKDSKDKDEWQAGPDDLLRPAAVEHDPRVPKFSRRERFVQEVVAEHPLLPRAMVNRLWAIMMGRGIIHPFDEMDTVHEPSHPELLGWLSADFAANGFDIRRTVRMIALSDAYQLESIRPKNVNDPATFAWYLERPLTAEQLARSTQLVLRNSFKDDHKIITAFRQQFRDVLPDENLVKLPDAMFLSNNAALDEFINKSNDEGHLIPALVAMGSDEERAQLLFQTLFGREAEANEVAAIADFLSDKSDDIANEQIAIRQAIWAVLSCSEFRFNH